MYYFEILSELYKKKIKYLVVGGLAVNLYGVPRATHDIDLIISTEKSNITALNAVLKNLGYVPRLPVDPEDLADPEKVKDWVENKNLKAFSFHHKKDGYKVIDILLVHPLDFGESFRGRTVKKVKGIEIYLAPLDDLIETKKAAGRPQDLSDIALLEKAKRYAGGE